MRDVKPNFAKKQKPPAAIAAGAKIADSDFDFFLDRVFRERKRSGPSLCEQAGEDGHQTAAEDARDTGDELVVYTRSGATRTFHVGDTFSYTYWFRLTSGLSLIHISEPTRQAS